MKKSHLMNAILARLTPALLVLSSPVMADEAVIERQLGSSALNSGTRFWTIPALSRQWGIPERSTHWTIPRSAASVADRSEDDRSFRVPGRMPER
jgi:hypothetical protein